MKTLSYIFKKFLILATVFLAMALICLVDSIPQHPELFFIILVSFIAYLWLCAMFTTTEDWKFFKNNINYEE